jgi:hypothetical protein
MSSTTAWVQAGSPWVGITVTVTCGAVFSERDWPPEGT